MTREALACAVLLGLSAFGCGADSAAPACDANACAPGEAPSVHDASVPDAAVIGGEVLAPSELVRPAWSVALHDEVCGELSVQVPPVVKGTFVDVAESAGVRGGEKDPCAESSLECHATSMTGGVAAGDFDADGLPDLYVTRIRDDDALYLNCGAGRFANVTERMGIAKAGGPSNGVSFADVDADGDLDLFVSSFGQYAVRHYLYVLEDGVYREDGIGRGVAQLNEGPLYGTGVAFGDYDRDGYLDLYVGEWRQDSLVPEGAPARNHARLFHNRGKARPGYFEDVTEAAGVAVGGTTSNGIATLEGVFVFTPTFSDLDGDGLVDLALASDYGSSKLFWNRGDGTFEDGTALAQVGTDQAGMGSAIGDHDGDGRLDWFVTSIFEDGRGYDGNRLFRNLGGRRFEDYTELAGMRDAGWGWGAAMFDFDLDGDNDSLAVSGFTNNEGARREYESRVFLWRHPGRAALREGVRCDEVAAAMTPTAGGQGRGVALLDFDADGDQDTFLVNFRGHDALLRNDVPSGGHFLRVRLQGSTNRFGIGARITAISVAGRQVQELTAGSGFLSQSEPVAQFGFASDEPVDLEIRWPDTGVIQRLESIAVQRTIVVVEP